MANELNAKSFFRNFRKYIKAKTDTVASAMRLVSYFIAKATKKINDSCKWSEIEFCALLIFKSENSMKKVIKNVKMALSK